MRPQPAQHPSHASPPVPRTLLFLREQCRHRTAAELGGAAQALHSASAGHLRSPCGVADTTTAPKHLHVASKTLGDGTPNRLPTSSLLRFLRPPGSGPQPGRPRAAAPPPLPLPSPQNPAEARSRPRAQTHPTPTPQAPCGLLLCTSGSFKPLSFHKLRKRRAASPRPRVRGRSPQ